LTAIAELAAFAPLWLALSLQAGAAGATPPASAEPPAGRFQAAEVEAAARAFASARAASDRDAGKLWGRPVYGPLLLVDPASRRVLASQADAEGKLHPRDGLFEGEYPADRPIANTAVEWAGVRWAMILLPLPDDLETRLELLEHELFHRLQPELGLPPASYTIAHLDGLEGRTWLRLEWRALRAAIEGAGEAKRLGLEDALVFRAHRRALFPAGAGEERALEMNEGLAEDTGCALAAETPEVRRRLALQFLGKGEKRPSFARSFAYASGPAYGLLLDEKAAGWRKGLTPESDLGALLAGATGFQAPAELGAEAARRAGRYDGAALRTEEAERERQRLERAAASRKRFVEGPTLTLPLREPQVSFNPNRLEPLDELGTVYRTLELVEAWGSLKVDEGGGALLTGDWSRLTLPAPATRPGPKLEGDGWTLTLGAGWRWKPGARSGDWVLVSEP
jgi:hypothetical protein